MRGLDGDTSHTLHTWQTQSLAAGRKGRISWVVKVKGKVKGKGRGKGRGKGGQRGRKLRHKGHGTQRGGVVVEGDVERSSGQV